MAQMAQGSRGISGFRRLGLVLRQQPLLALVSVLLLGMAIGAFVLGFGTAQGETFAIERAQAMGSVFGQAVTPEGSGTGEGDARQGNPVGQGSSEGHSWSLNGRALVGKLIDPLYEVNVEGRVTVSIRVDESGNVVGVSIGRPTDISDAAIQRAALDAARKAKFSVGDNVAVGTITYHFKLK